MQVECDKSSEIFANIERLLKLLIRLKLSELKGEHSQKEMILLLDSIGFKSGEIIDLLGAAESSVRPTLSKAHKERK